MYGIFIYIWVIYGVNVGKYSIHGAYGHEKLHICSLLQRFCWEILSGQVNGVAAIHTEIIKKDCDFFGDKKWSQNCWEKGDESKMSKVSWNFHRFFGGLESFFFRHSDPLQTKVTCPRAALCCWNTWWGPRALVQRHARALY